MTSAIYTIGHSTHPIGEFIGLLRQHEIGILVDIRTIPKSKHNPQYEQGALKSALSDQAIQYEYMKDLGGLRHAKKDSPNGGWRNASFRGYADYMQTKNFEKALEKLLELREKGRVAIMCAEAVPWRCHRSLVADALLVRGIPALDIMPDGRLSEHKLTKFAQVQGKAITYPSENYQLL
ncbi:MAG: DUF488 domain-containing protein [Alphaproteobacteria bacterium PRO2]|nr:DUF488 domain-containing protein [Alphaproteobacteria bacterium PRO2]